ncbi:hypothetical protein PanWU01x14_223630, partial [Parasponia andersonii]
RTRESATPAVSILKCFAPHHYLVHPGIPSNRKASYIQVYSPANGMIFMDSTISLS